MKCYLKPSNYTCKSCLETQMDFNVAENCNECEYSGDCKDSWKNDNFTITRK